MSMTPISSFLKRFVIHLLCYFSIMLGLVRSFAIRAPLTTRHVAPLIFRSLATKAANSIDIYDEQDILTDISKPKLRNTIERIRKILGYERFGVSLLLVDDDEMQETNLETRGVNGPTDILSFQFHEAVEPGLLKPPEFEIPDYYTLGDMLVDVPYVVRRCLEDAQVETLGDDADDEDRGVSAAMATVFDPELRIHMLLVHGMLHLVGYDHIKDKDYELMVTKEEEILKELSLEKQWETAA